MKTYKMTVDGDEVRLTLEGETVKGESVTRKELVEALAELEFKFGEHLTDQAFREECKVEELCLCWTDSLKKAQDILARLEGDKAKTDKHTPGPWSADDGGGFVRAGGDYVLFYSMMTNDRKEERSANARLIALAPEMAETIRIIMPWLSKAMLDDPFANCAGPHAARMAYEKGLDMLTRLDEA